MQEKVMQNIPNDDIFFNNNKIVIYNNRNENKVVILPPKKSLFWFEPQKKAIRAGKATNLNNEKRK